MIQKEKRKYEPTLPPIENISDLKSKESAAALYFGLTVADLFKLTLEFGMDVGFIGGEDEYQITKEKTRLERAFRDGWDHFASQDDENKDPEILLRRLGLSGCFSKKTTSSGIEYFQLKEKYKNKYFPSAASSGV